MLGTCFARELLLDEVCPSSSSDERVAVVVAEGAWSTDYLVGRALLLLLKSLPRTVGRVLPLVLLGQEASGCSRNVSGGCAIAASRHSIRVCKSGISCNTSDDCVGIDRSIFFSIGHRWPNCYLIICFLLQSYFIRR